MWYQYAENNLRIKTRNLKRRRWNWVGTTRKCLGWKSKVNNRLLLTKRIKVLIQWPNVALLALLASYVLFWKLLWPIDSFERCQNDTKKPKQRVRLKLKSHRRTKRCQIEECAIRNINTLRASVAKLRFDQFSNNAEHFYSFLTAVEAKQVWVGSTP